MPVLGPEEIREFDVDGLAIRVFLKALELIGGPRKLIEYRNLTWITSLMEASYAIVMFEEANKTEEEIAQFLGLTKQTVRNILRADPELVLKKLEGELKEKSTKAHTAGGLAKLALKEIRSGRDNLQVFMQAFEQALSDVGVIWPVEVLRKLKGAKFPITKEELIERLKGITIEGKKIEDVVEKTGLKVFESPRVILREISKVLKQNKKEE